MSKVLAPLGELWNIIANVKANSVCPEKVSAYVICAGNVVVGGAGKTLAVELMCDILKANNHNPHIITSGYGGYIKNVVRVEPEIHSYLQVGDESLLSAIVAPTWIGKNKIHACRAAISAGADILVMDDGLQNNSVLKDFKILVVDSMQGFGNEKLCPAGPLREPLDIGIKKADIVLIVGDRNEQIETRIAAINPDIKIYHAKTEIVEYPKIDSQNVVGFCGLGYPEKFRKTLQQLNLDIVDFISFSDHHAYTITEIQKLITAAKNTDATLVTTMKDYVKIPKVFKAEIKVIGVKLKAEEEFSSAILKSLANSDIL
jgi:tetraacyldisaccharide 4'-kinase